MGRKHKFVNKTHYPDWAIERFTRCIFDDVLAFFATEEGQKEYEEWEAEQARQAELNRTKKRAASTAALCLLGLLLSGATGFGFGPYLPAVSKIGLLVTGEINK